MCRHGKNKKLCYTQAHAVYGIFKGHSLYGVADIKLLAASMQSVVTECGVAAKSADARDKYFQSYVGEAGICSSSSLRSEVPSLEALFICFFA